jgi:hypothetical protein
MTEKKRGAGAGAGTRRSDRPGASVASGLEAKRSELVHTFFKKGAEITEELARENNQLRKRSAELERENAQLKSQLAKDRAMKDLLKKIEELETERDTLLTSIHEKEAAESRVSNRFAEIEQELESFANLYVASYQLHSTLRLSIVVGHVKELLLQLVGARSLALYVRDLEGRTLVPIASEGAGELRPIKLNDDANDAARMQIERAYLTGVASIVEGDVASADARLPVACVPMRFDTEVVGVIVVFSLLEQKHGFVAVDHELFKLLGAHAGTALIGARLFADAGEKLPDLERLRDAAS